MNAIKTAISTTIVSVALTLGAHAGQTIPLTTVWSSEWLCKSADPLDDHVRIVVIDTTRRILTIADRDKTEHREDEDITSFDSYYSEYRDEVGHSRDYPDAAVHTKNHDFMSGPSSNLSFRGGAFAKGRNVLFDDCIMRFMWKSGVDPYQEDSTRLAFN